jgi:hypothetical protein
MPVSPSWITRSSEFLAAPTPPRCVAPMSRRPRPPPDAIARPGSTTCAETANTVFARISKARAVLSIPRNGASTTRARWRQGRRPQRIASAEVFYRKAGAAAGELDDALAFCDPPSSSAV